MNCMNQGLDFCIHPFIEIQKYTLEDAYMYIFTLNYEFVLWKYYCGQTLEYNIVMFIVFA